MKRSLKPKRPARKGKWIRADWDNPCSVCSNVPTFPLTGMCMACTTGCAQDQVDFMRDDGIEVSRG